jgi:hypothetical protein
MYENLKTLLAEAAQLHGTIAAGQHRSILELSDTLAKASQVFEKTAQRRANQRDSEARRFNVFCLTERAHFEVTTHQTVLADLLNPIGSHGQGNLFLRPFLELVTAGTGISLAGPDGLWEVDHGQSYIDVRLRHSSTNDAVVIETKWDASDRPGQLVDYWESELKRTHKDRIPVVFIAKNRRDPDLGPPRPTHARFKRDLVCLSYRLEFADLLRTVLGEVRAPRVRETLAQYLDLLAAIETIDDEGEEQ